MAGLPNSSLLLIVIAAMEKFSYKGVTSNFVTYLTDVVKMTNSAAAKTVHNWIGFNFMLPLIVAAVIDSFSWDRYPTILASYFPYIAGLLGLTISTTYKMRSPSMLFCSLHLISLGQGGYSPSFQAFARDQLEGSDPSKESLFYNWSYFGICCGSLFGITLLSCFQESFGWTVGFAIPTFSLVTSATVFLCGRPIYTCTRRQRNNSSPYALANIMLKNIKATTSYLMNCRVRNENVVAEQEHELLPDQQSSSGNKGLDQNPGDGVHKNLLEFAKVSLRILPVWTMLLFSAVVMQQPATLFTKQGMTMQRNIGSHFQIPPATLQSATTLTVILLAPIYSKVLIPILTKITCNERHITVMQRMGIGMFITVITMITAALVETKRLQMSGKMKMLGTQTDQTVPLSIFWLLPQYILLGLADIFTVVGMQEFFNSRVPMEGRSLASGMYTSVFGVGSYLSAILITAVENITSSKGGRSWFSDDLSEARLDNYYWLLAFLSAVAFVFYVIFCRLSLDSCCSNLDNRNSNED